MKKTIALLLALVMMLSLAACGSSDDAKDQSDGNETEKDANIQVDEKLLSVDVTLNASFFDDQSEDDIKANAKENGYDDCKINSDGSVTYTMSKAKHTEMLNELKKTCEESIGSCLDGENKVPSFVDIKYNDNFSKIDVYVDADKYTMFDSLYAMAFYINGAFYQSFDGVANEDIDVVVNFINNETKEVLDTASYRDAINNLNSEDNKK